MFEPCGFSVELETHITGLHLVTAIPVSSGRCFVVFVTGHSC